MRFKSLDGAPRFVARTTYGQQKTHEVAFVDHVRVIDRLPLFTNAAPTSVTYGIIALREKKALTGFLKAQNLKTQIVIGLFNSWQYLVTKCISIMNNVK